MKILGSAVLIFCLVGVIAARDHAAQTHAATQPKAETLMQGLGNLHHPVSTGNPQAQQFFDQGLRLIYAFNHEVARVAETVRQPMMGEIRLEWWRETVNGARLGRPRDHDVARALAELFAARRLPAELFETIIDARAFERRMKKWNRAWKLKRIEEHNPQWRDLYPELASHV